MSYWQLIILVLVYTGGALSALHALRYARTSQGAVAWVLSLILFPHLGLILYWFLGPHKFYWYLQSLEQARKEQKQNETKTLSRVEECSVRLADKYAASQKLLKQIFSWPVTAGNKVELLIDGEETFEAIFQSIEQARDYIFLQFYIVRDDALGKKLKAALIKKAAEGIKVYLLIDSIGSFWLSRHYISELKAAGISVEAFSTSRGILSRFSVNFRNHRKIALIDGQVAYVGGHNVGDEYLGKSEQFGHWRDTHIKVQGPAVTVIQASFLEDWYFVTRNLLEVNINAFTETQDENIPVLPFYTGPTTQLENCSLMFMEAISVATKRFWIASPYFVPDEPLVQALQAAALKGIDVRVLVPMKPDHWIVWLAGLSYFDEMLDAGVRLYRYENGFLHQKTFLVDDYWSCVGTANLDNRSLSLNFELSVLVFDSSFAKKMERMFLADFEVSSELSTEEIESLPLSLSIVSSIARLFSPVL